MKFAAHYVVCGNGQLLPKGIVELDATGRILSVQASGQDFREQAGLEFHSGLICPAFPPVSIEQLLRELPKTQAYQAYLPENLNHPRAIFLWIQNIQLQLTESKLTELIELFAAKSAEVFGFADAGVLEVGKRPGLINLTGIDYTSLRLTASSRLKKLI